MKKSSGINMKMISAVFKAQARQLLQYTAQGNPLCTTYKFKIEQRFDFQIPKMLSVVICFSSIALGYSILNMMITL